MTRCSIISCGARKNKNQPRLSLHSFPRNEALKKKWIDSIRTENINTDHKEWRVCSLHFEEKCFNFTLDVVRLREGSIPTIFNQVSDSSKTNILCEPNTVPECSVSGTSNSVPSMQFDTSKEKLLPEKKSKDILVLVGNKIKNLDSSGRNSGMPPPILTNAIVESIREKVTYTNKIRKLTQKCIEQRKKIKLLSEQLQCKKKKIAKLNKILNELKKKK